MGRTDRVLRFTITAIIVLLYVSGEVRDEFGLGLMILGAILALSAFVRFCPLYAIFGIHRTTISGADQ